MSVSTVGWLLEELGDNPAETLRQLGYKGQRDNVNRCPVAMYLCHNGVFAPVVMPAYTAAYRRRWNNPAPVRAFIEAFDQGLHPDLEAT